MGRGDLVSPLATQIRTQYVLKSRLFLGMLTETNKKLADRKKGNARLNLEGCLP